MKFIDLFCGMGTIRMGFERAGHECVYAVEWDKHKRRIYSVIFGHEPQGRDITDTRAIDLPAADCWSFGAPCQDFSVAGLREGMEGDRSSLVREVFRLARETPEEHRPEWLLYENVKGMLSSNKGFDYLEILFEMASLGYDIEYQLLNSKNYGVPQNRERVYTLGHLRRYGERKIFPFRTDNGNFDEASEPEEIIMYADCGVGHKWVERKSITPPLRSQGGGNSPGIAIAEPLIAESGLLHSRGFETRHDGISHAVKGAGGGSSKNMVAISYDLKATPGSTRRGTVKIGYTGALDTQCNVGVDHNKRIRKLTPRECMRLQGVSDKVTDKLIAAGISDTQMYRAAGDACTVNVIFEIAKRLEIAEIERGL